MKQVDEIPRPRAGHAQYDYATLFNGETWCLEQGEDFETKPPRAAVAIRRAAKIRKLEATIAVRGNKVFVKAETDDE